MSDTFNDKIDITMTSVLRPAILSETLVKIKKHVCHGDDSRFRLIINIDQIGEDVEPLRLVKICQKNFSKVVYNISEKPSFPHAVKWVWSQSTAPFVFHWEDDVNILHDIDVDDMISILKKYDKNNSPKRSKWGQNGLSTLRLYKAPTQNKKIFHTFACTWKYYSEGFYIANDWKKQFGLNPILIKQEFIKEAVVRMVDNVNPEKQFRYSQEYMRPLIRKWQYGLYTKPGAPRMIDGRKGQRWKNQMGVDKPKGVTFTKWVKKGK